MNKYKLLINLGLCVSLLFCLAFACNDGGGDKGDATQPKSSAETTRQDAAADDETASPVETQTGVGEPFGARDPRTCADSTAPTTGRAMTAALATKYLICSQEGVKSDYLYLVEGLATVRVGGAVPYNPQRFPYASDIDVEAPVYPFRTGSYKQYQCSAVTATSDNKGHNCNIYPYPNGEGVCVKSTFGDWSCTMSYQSGDRSQTKNNVPPPQTEY